MKYVLDLLNKEIKDISDEIDRINDVIVTCSGGESKKNKIAKSVLMKRGSDCFEARKIIIEATTVDEKRDYHPADIIKAKK